MIVSSSQVVVIVCRRQVDLSAVNISAERLHQVYETAEGISMCINRMEGPHTDLRIQPDLLRGLHSETLGLELGLYQNI